MDFMSWTAVAGALLLLFSLSLGWINRTLVPLFGLYLLVGIGLGPWVLDLVQIDIIKYSTIIAHCTEIAMAASLFMTGLKIRLPFSANGWKKGLMLAGPAMILTVLGVMVASHYLLGMSWPLALAMGAIVAPTDPVLASLIAISDSRDSDSLRLSLSTEAGLNDGTALPLLALALLLFQADGSLSFSEIGHWFSIEVLWSLAAGIAIGFIMGRGIGLITTHFRYTQREFSPSDFVALGLISLSFSVAMMLGASGFLAAFAAGVGLRSAELKIQHRFPDERQEKDGVSIPAEVVVNPHQRHGFQEANRVQSVGLVVGDALTFGDIVERIFAAAIIIVLGITIAQHWQPAGLIIAAVLFFAIRPAAVWLTTSRCSSSRYQRLMIGWLGIRGIGSLNYIAWAWTHGMRGEEVSFMLDCALTLVVASVLIHGISVTPLMSLRKKYQD